MHRELLFHPYTVVPFHPPRYEELLHLKRQIVNVTKANDRLRAPADKKKAATKLVSAKSIMDGVGGANSNKKMFQKAKSEKFAKYQMNEATKVGLGRCCGAREGGVLVRTRT